MILNSVTVSYWSKLSAVVTRYAVAYQSFLRSELHLDHSVFVLFVLLPFDLSFRRAAGSAFSTVCCLSDVHAHI